MPSELLTEILCGGLCQNVSSSGNTYGAKKRRAAAFLRLVEILTAAKSAAVSTSTSGCKVPSEQRLNRFAVVGIEEFAAELGTGKVDFAKVHYTNVAVEHRADVDCASPKVGRGGELRR